MALAEARQRAVGGINIQNALQQIQSASGGVKFGSMVVVTGQAQTETAQDATKLGGVLQLLVSMAQLQAAEEHPRPRRWRRRWQLPRKAAP